VQIPADEEWMLDPEPDADNVEQPIDFRRS
jgi:hypothetical protein